MLDDQSYGLGEVCTTEAVVQNAPAKSLPRTAREWLKAIGPRVSDVVTPFQCGAPWTAFATDLELRRLARLQARIDRKQRALSELKSERRLVMVRCVRRMRRDRGLDL